jgi:hypothetical protein
MSALAICLIASAFLDAHVTPINRPAPCDEGNAVVYADNSSKSNGGYYVESDMPRPWRVLIGPDGRVTDWRMQGVRQ